MPPESKSTVDDIQREFRAMVDMQKYKRQREVYEDGMRSLD